MLIATESRLFRLYADAGSAAPQPHLEADEILAIAEAGGLTVTATQDHNIHIRGGNGRMETIETGIGEEISSLLIIGAEAPILLIGTEPPHIYRFEIPGGRPVRMEMFDRLECRSDWNTPWGGPPAVRSLARGGESTVYADIHVGSIMRSGDLGATWAPVNPVLNRDVHQVNTTPAAPRRVYANTADAVWVSPDEGETWHHRPFPCEETYGRAIAVHPADPDCVLASVSKGPHGDDVRGRLFRSHDSGRTWTHATDGFPAYSQDNINTHRITFDSGGGAWAAAGDTLYRSEDRGRSWTPFWQAPARIEMLSG